jgi:hypothetical protein
MRDGGNAGGGCSELYADIPGAAEVAACLLRAAAADGSRPGAVLLAARMGTLLAPLAPLLDALGVVSLRVETWAAAAETALACETDPYGFNVPGAARCVRCGARPAQQPGGKLRKCVACRAAAYCGTACAKADWATHKELCGAMAAARATRRGGSHD